MRHTHTSLAGALFIVACLAQPAAKAQDLNLESVHWAYSSYFGTGWYEVNDERNVYVLRMTPRWDLREANIAEDGARRIGYELSLAITAGLDRFSLDDLPGVVEPDNLASLSVTPGISMTVPVTERWSLRPFAHIGWGKLLSGSSSAWAYWGGIKSRLEFQSGKLEWALLNAITYVGSSPSDSFDDNFWPVMIGLDFDYPIGHSEQQLFLGLHTTYTTFENDLELSVKFNEIEPITDQWEVGVSLHRKEQPLKFWFFRFDRLGLGYRASSTGDLRGVTFIFRSVFDN
jgi:hypothetical protein